MNIHEAVNWSRQEHLVALSERDLEDYRTSLRRSPPRLVAHWDMEADKVGFECLARRIPEPEAVQFLEKYIQALSLPGWTVHALKDD